MQSTFRRIILFVILAVLGVIPGFGWDDVGHKITAYVAWQRMTQPARDNVIRILRKAPEDSQLATFYMSYGAQPEATRKREFFMLVSTWADIVRDREFTTRYKKYNKGNWHYDDTFWRQSNGRLEVLSGFENGGEGVQRLVDFDKLIRDTSAPDGEKAIAIAWMMHVGGDLHQPLHTSARVTEVEPKGDEGGNLFLLTPQGTPRLEQRKLHSYWDSIVGANIPIKGETCDRSYIEPIAQSMMSRHPFARMRDRLQLGRYADWQKESFAMNLTDVYTPDLIRFQAPSQRYKRNAYRVSERQLVLAGYRLGETMNAVFDVPVPAATRRQD